MKNLIFSFILLLTLYTTDSFSQFKGGLGDGSSMAITAGPITLGSCMAFKEVPVKINQHQISITAFPNPFSKKVTLKIGGNLNPEKNYSISIFNVFNQPIAELKNIQSNEVNFHFNQSSGEFIYRLYADEILLGTGLLVQIKD